MTDTIKIEWECQDGYAGGSRPHVVKIDVADLVHCITQAEIEDYIDEVVEEDFKQRCSPYWDTEQADGLWDKVSKARMEIGE